MGQPLEIKTKKAIRSNSGLKISKNIVANSRSNALFIKRQGTEIEDFSNVRKGIPS
jgi:hypothetical protein